MAGQWIGSDQSIAELRESQHPKLNWTGRNADYIPLTLIAINNSGLMGVQREAHPAWRQATSSWM